MRAEIELTGTYQHTSAELAFGARVAWRNSARCIGRLYWRSMQVRDLRAVREPAEVAAQCVEHLRIAYNGGKIRPVITVFAPDAPGRPGPRIWNEQLIRYAGYRPAGRHGARRPALRAVHRGGHPARLARRRHPGAFDVLPLVVSDGRRDAPGRRCPRDAVAEVPLHHPDLAVVRRPRPALARGAGDQLHAAVDRRGELPGRAVQRLVHGHRDRRAQPRRRTTATTCCRRSPRGWAWTRASEQTLWRDAALVEVNRAVLHSFAAAGVTISDHHTESARFLKHLEKEEQAGRTCPADWSWIVPPMSGALTPVYHRYYDTDHLKPEFVADDDSAARGARGRGATAGRARAGASSVRCGPTSGTGRPVR